jgi:hypothetical protein
MRLILAVLLVSMLTGCASLAQRKAAFAQSMDIYVGKSADDLVIAEGPPSGTYRLSTGGQVFEYFKTRTVLHGGSYTVMQPIYMPGANGGTWMSVPTQLAAPVSSSEYFCKLLFRISAKNVVESWTAQGNDCY